MIKISISVTSDALAPILPSVTNCHTLSDPLERDVLYGRPQMKAVNLSTFNYGHLYEELNTKEGEAKIYKTAKTRQRNRMNKQAVNMIKDNNGKILTDEEAIKD